MNITALGSGLFAVFFSVMTIASTSLGIQCYQDAKMDTKSSKYRFQIAYLVMACISLLFSFGGLYYAFVRPY